MDSAPVILREGNTSRIEDTVFNVSFAEGGLMRYSALVMKYCHGNSDQTYIECKPYKRKFQCEKFIDLMNFYDYVLEGGRFDVVAQGEEKECEAVLRNLDSSFRCKTFEEASAILYLLVTSRKS